MNDDPVAFMERVTQLADTYTVLGKAEVAQSVKVLGQVAADDEHPLQSVATVALQIMAQAYNVNGGS